MARVSVDPQPFRNVEFDTELLVTLAERALVAAGLPDDQTLRIAVDETTPLGRTWIESLDPLAIGVESGAFEDAKKPRRLSEANVLDVLGRLLHRVVDRRDPAFAGAPPEDDLDQAQRAAWDTYCTARSGRAGLPVQVDRWRYIFRNRHGFTDVADAAFERIWRATGLTWADLAAICADTESAAPRTA
jgi:hypothetical protein